MTHTKDCPARVKAVGTSDGLEEGQFTALVSVFGNRDSMGDVVLPGAFAETLAEWKGRGDPIPVIWSHDWSDPFSHIGHVTEAEETPDGLVVTGQLDLDNPKAQQVGRLLKGRRVTQFSFAYDVVEGAWVEQEDARPYYELRKLKLHEVGPTLIGANQETELLAAKAVALAEGAKAGRVLAQQHLDRLKEAHVALGEVISAADPDPEKSTTPTPGTTPTESGQPGTAPASGTTPPAQDAATEPAQDAKTGADPDGDARITTEDMRVIAQFLAAELAKTATAPAAADTTTTIDRSTEDQATPDHREASEEDAAKAGTASLRLRHDLELLELEASLTE